MQTSQGLVQDAYVRDNNKLGVVVFPKVRPNEVRLLAKSLAQGFHKNFPNQDLKVLIYASDKKLILTKVKIKIKNPINKFSCSESTNVVFLVVHISKYIYLFSINKFRGLYLFLSGHSDSRRNQRSSHDVMRNC